MFQIFIDGSFDDDEFGAAVWQQFPEAEAITTTATSGLTSRRRMSMLDIATSFVTTDDQNATVIASRLTATPVGTMEAEWFSKLNNGSGVTVMNRPNATTSVELVHAPSQPPPPEFVGIPLAVGLEADEGVSINMLIIIPCAVGLLSIMLLIFALRKQRKQREGSSMEDAGNTVQARQLSMSIDHHSVSAQQAAPHCEDASTNDVEHATGRDDAEGSGVLTPPHAEIDDEAPPRSINTAEFWEYAEMVGLTPHQPTKHPDAGTSCPPSFTSPEYWQYVERAQRGSTTPVVQPSGAAPTSMTRSTTEPSLKHPRVLAGKKLSALFIEASEEPSTSVVAPPGRARIADESAPAVSTAPSLSNTPGRARISDLSANVPEATASVRSAASLPSTPNRARIHDSSVPAIDAAASAPPTPTIGLTSVVSAARLAKAKKKRDSARRVGSPTSRRPPRRASATKRAQPTDESVSVEFTRSVSAMGGTSTEGQGDSPVINAASVASPAKRSGLANVARSIYRSVSQERLPTTGAAASVTDPTAESTRQRQARFKSVARSIHESSSQGSTDVTEGAKLDSPHGRVDQRI